MRVGKLKTAVARALKNAFRIGIQAAVYDARAFFYS